MLVVFTKHGLVKWWSQFQKYSFPPVNLSKYNNNFNKYVKFSVLTLTVLSDSNLSVSANRGSTYCATSGTFLSLRLWKKATKRSSAWFLLNGLISGWNAQLMRIGTSAQFPSHTLVRTNLNRPGWWRQSLEGQETTTVITEKNNRCHLVQKVSCLKQEGGGEDIKAWKG